MLMGKKKATIKKESLIIKEKIRMIIVRSITKKIHRRSSLEINKVQLIITASPMIMNK